LIAELPNVRLNLANRPENVSLVRDVLVGVAEAVELDASGLNDIRTAVTEACNNVVLHAYEGAEGPLEIEVYAPSSAIEVVVRDHGTGIRPHIGASDEGTSGIGLLVIQALVDSVEFKGAEAPTTKKDGVGTEVRMTFATAGAGTLEPGDGDGFALPVPARAELANTVAITIAPARLAGSLLPRLLSVLAARAHFSTDRISDAQLIADAIVAHAPESMSGSQLSVGIKAEPRDLELRIAPLRAGGARHLVVDSAVEGLGPVIAKLTDNQEVAALGSSEMLVLRLVDQR
jgi:serine/threonine-protein kinase RsbW